MRAIKYRELKRMYDTNGPEKTVTHLGEALKQGHLKPEDFSIRELAEVTLGNERVRQMDPRHGANLLEVDEGVDVTAFSNIIGQVVQSKIMAAYMQEAFVVSKLVDVVPSDDVAEDYIETPQTTKRGFIVPVTREAIFFDRTHLILQRAAEIGEILGLNKETRLINLLIGVTNNYKWKGTDYNTYSTAGTGVAPDGDWINETTDELVVMFDVDAAKQLFADILDPNTGKPMLVQSTTVLVMPAYRHAAHRIFNLAENYRVVESWLAYRRVIASGESAAAAKKWWFIGDFRKALAYMENWPITITQSPPNSEAEFNQDIVVRFKASERGAAAVINPRYIVKSDGSS